MLPVLESISSPQAVGLLKCCTQSMVAPHAMRAKYSRLSAVSPFNGSPGSWSVDVQTATLRVVHVKRERARDAARDYEFEWACEFSLSAKGSSVELTDERASLRSYTCQHADLKPLIEQAFA